MNADTILAARAQALQALDTRVLRGKLWQLSEEHFVQVVSWLEDRTGYEATEKLCVEELKLPPAKAPDKNALWRFWEHSGFRSLLQREHRRWCAGEANTAAADAIKSPADWERANVDKIQQVTYELLHGGADPGTVKPFIQAFVKLRDQDQKKVDSKLEREKFEAETCALFLRWVADKRARDIAEASGVTNADKIKQLRQTFFADVDALEQSGEVQLPPA